MDTPPSSDLKTDAVDFLTRPRGALDNFSAAIARNWGWVMLRGILGIIVGLIAIFQPLATIAALVLLFAIFSIADGITAVISSVKAMRADQRWFWMLIGGLVSFGAAAVALFMPVLAVKVFILILGIWAMIGGIALIVAAFKLDIDHGRWWLVFAGALSILWGVLLLMQPAIGAVVLAIWFGVYTLTFGIFFTIIAFTLRSRHKARVAG